MSSIETRNPPRATETARHGRWRDLTRTLVAQTTVRAFRAFNSHNTMQLAAALAFYTTLSLAPLVIVLMWILSLMHVGGAEHLTREVENLIGKAGADVVAAIIDNSKEGRSIRGVAGVISIAMLMFSASGIFSELQGSLNRIWDVEAKPGLGLRGWLRKRLASFAMLGVIAFLLLVSLAASAAVSLVARWSSEGLLLHVLSIAASIAVYALLFGTVLKVLPDVRVPWRDVVTGAVVTSILFSVGKTAIALYLTRAAVGNAYGAAGSLVVVLVWVYYSSIVVLFGAELTEAWAYLRGRRFLPNRYAIARPACRDRMPEGTDSAVVDRAPARSR